MVFFHLDVHGSAHVGVFVCRFGDRDLLVCVGGSGFVCMQCARDCVLVDDL